MRDFDRTDLTDLFEQVRAEAERIWGGNFTVEPGTLASVVVVDCPDDTQIRGRVDIVLDLLRRRRAVARA